MIYHPNCKQIKIIRAATRCPSKVDVWGVSKKTGSSSFLLSSSPSLSLFLSLLSTFFKALSAGFVCFSSCSYTLSLISALSSVLFGIFFKFFYVIDIILSYAGFIV